MKLCFPTVADDGAKSAIYGHFASAPLFVIVDTETHRSTSVANCDPERPFEGTDPFSALKGRELDGIIVGGIGDDALRAMSLCGYRVFEATSASLVHQMALFKEGALAELEVMESHLEGRCSDSGGGKCNHQHD